MLSFSQQENDRTGRLSRRRLLRVGSLGMGALTLSDLLRYRAQAGMTKQLRDTAVIHVFLGGGPSHIDTFDMKPNAPREIRGEFSPIATSVPGISICEHLPCLAKVMQYLTIVRSVAHTNPSHLPASHWMMTGYEPAVSARRNDNPYSGAVVAKLRGPNVKDMPAYVSVPRRQIFGGAAYLGSAYNPFTPESDPNADDYHVQNLDLPTDMSVLRLQARDRLLREFNGIDTCIHESKEAARIDPYTRAAFDMVTNPRVQQAFDISRESTPIRDFYGRTSAGQRCLLARRLIEAGATFVTVLPGGDWDTHVANFVTLRNTCLPLIDRALAALVTDLYARGLDRRVLLLVSGEFGRTPTINKDAGRDHWPGAMSVLFAGGGMQSGRVLGATDSRGAYPKTRSYTPGDLLATVYNFLGISLDAEFHDHTGRPLRILPEGQPIAELIG